MQVFWSVDINIEIRTRRLLRFYQNESRYILVQFATSLLMLQHEQFLTGTWKIGPPWPREFFHPQPSRENVFNDSDGPKEVISNLPRRQKNSFVEMFQGAAPASKVTARGEENFAG
jgi:hypothetical protein